MWIEIIAVFACGFMIGAGSTFTRRAWRRNARLRASRKAAAKLAALRRKMRPSNN